MRALIREGALISKNEVEEGRLFERGRLFKGGRLFESLQYPFGSRCEYWSLLINDQPSVLGAGSGKWLALLLTLTLVLSLQALNR